MNLEADPELLKHLQWERQKAEAKARRRVRHDRCGCIKCQAEYARAKEEADRFVTAYLSVRRAAQAREEQYQAGIFPTGDVPGGYRTKLTLTETIEDPPTPAPVPWVWRVLKRLGLG